MSEKITCIVIDDETPALNLVAQFILQSTGLVLIEKFKSPVKAIEFLSNNKVDIIFCDIQMPEINGIQLAKVISQKSMLIFTTAYSEFATDAFDIDAIDYLRKPFSFERFTKAVNKAKEQLQLKSVKEISLPEIQEAQKNYLTVKANHKITKIFFDDILFVEAYQEYVKIITPKERIITFERMKNMESLLPADKFIRVHRSYIVSINKIHSISGNLLEISGYQIPVSRDLKDTVMKMLW